ncbi:MAG: MarC family protein [Candidatus Woesearchaeota archaeon]|jgi:multiple antibiotic resistance protein
MDGLIQLIVLFFVIFDPLASAMVFVSATRNMKSKDMVKVGIYATLVAMSVSAIFLLFGNTFLTLFNTDMNDIKIAGGILLGILGVKMALGYNIVEDETKSGNSSNMAVASLIGTPLLTGPAAITTILITTHDYGMLSTGIAIFAVLLFAGLIFFILSKFAHKIKQTPIQVISTILGLITLAWGINFIRTGLGF